MMKFEIKDKTKKKKISKHLKIKNIYIYMYMYVVNNTWVKEEKNAVQKCIKSRQKS